MRTANMFQHWKEWNLDLVFDCQTDKNWHGETLIIKQANDFMFSVWLTCSQAQGKCHQHIFNIRVNSWRDNCLYWFDFHAYVSTHDRIPHCCQDYICHLQVPRSLQDSRRECKHCGKPTQSHCKQFKWSECYPRWGTIGYFGVVDNLLLWYF